ncbi:uncharacterized [Tachysurus ichikawai]
MIRVLEIEFGEESGPLEQLKGRRHKRQWVTVLDSYGIKCPIVCAGSQSDVLLTDKKETGFSVGGGWAVAHNYAFARQERDDVGQGKEEDHLALHEKGSPQSWFTTEAFWG